MTIFFIPFGGGSELSYAPYTKFFDKKNIKQINLSYPGRGKRIKENLIYDYQDLTDDIFNQINNHLKNSKKNKEYAIFGHSLGGIITYTVTNEIIRQELQPPKRLFISGRKAPTILKDKSEFISDLPSETFWKEIIQLGGTNQDFLKEEELKFFFEPILRADMKVVESFEYTSKPQLNIPLTVLYGNKDDMELEDLRAWQDMTTSCFELIEFHGDHFFIFSRKEEVLNSIFQYYT